MTISIETSQPHNNIISVTSSSSHNFINIPETNNKSPSISVNGIVSNKGEGSFYIVCENIAERDSISNDKRGLGLIAYVISDDNLYQLQGGLSNNYWEILIKPFASVGMFNPPANPNEGVIYYDLTEEKLKIFMFQNWQEIPNYEIITGLISDHNNDIHAHKSLFEVSKNFWKSIL